MQLVKKKNYPPQQDIDKLSDIKKALERVLSFSFWNNKCLVQSFAGRWMLSKRKINSILFIGAKRDENLDILAHAWLVSFDLEIVPKDEEFEILLRL